MGVRGAVPADARAIAEVHVGSWRVAYRGLLPDTFLAGLSVERRETLWQDLLSQSGWETFVAEEADGIVVGFANLAPSRDPDATPGTGELTAIYVAPSHWGRGHGGALLRAVLASARTRGFRRLTLWVLRGNDRATGFYEAAGFSPDGVEKTEVRSGDLVLRECRYGLDL